MSVTLRTDLRPGDIGSIVQMHGAVYAREYGFDVTFEAYVAGPLARYALAPSDGDRLWIADRDAQVVGSVAIIEASAEEGQLRWFLVDPSARRQGLGTRLLNGAVAFARERGYHSVFLWSVSLLAAAARLYRAAGFEKAEERPGRRWGVEVAEERYVLKLTAPR
jgi:ribosomal protein S18 acetylase RimI-like enzyme